MADEIKQTIVIEASLTKIQSDLKQLEGSFRSTFANISRGASSALGALGVGISAGAIVGFSKEVLSLADNLQNLHDQTGLSVEVLSGMKSTLEESGSSMDAFGRGVFNLQKNLGNVDEDTDKVAQSIKRLGLNLDDLRNSSPDDFIKKVTDALATIENPVERNTVLFNLLGKSAKELGPALQQLAGRFDELRAKGLSGADVKTLDDVGDALTRLKNQALVLGAEGVAGILRFAGAIRDLPNVASQLDAATERAAKAFNLPKARIEGMSSKEIIAQAEAVPETFFKSRQFFRNARDDVLNLREEFDKLNKVNVKVPTAPFKGISDSAKKAKSEVDNFLEGLEKQLATLQNKNIELTFGPSAALGAQLDTQLEQFKEKLRASGTAIPKGLDDFFGVLKDKIVGADDALRNLNASLEETTKRQQALADDANEGVGIVATSLTPQQAASIANAKKQIDDLRQQLTIGAIDTTTPEGKEKKRIAEIELDFAKTASNINDLGRQMGQSQKESAELVALAWKKALAEINNAADATDELTKFQERAFEKMQDFLAGGINDLLQGNIKSWKDWGLSIKKVIDGLVAESLALQIKTALFGEKLGAKTGGTQVGGLVGQIGQIFSGSSSAAIPARTPPVNPVNIATSTISQVQQGDIFNTFPAAVTKAADAAIVNVEAAGAVAEKGVETAGATMQSEFGSFFKDTFKTAFSVLTTGGLPLPSPIIKDNFGPPATQTEIADAIKNITRPVIPETTTHEDFVREVSQISKSLESDLEHAIQTGGSLLSRGAGAAGQVANAAAQTQPAIAQTAIQALSTEATTIIQTASVEAQTILQAIYAETTTAIQVSSAAAETAITALAATTEASITALQAVAITAIEAAAAKNAISNSGDLAQGASVIGSIFSAGAAVGHSGGRIDSTLPIRRFHSGGVINPAVNSVQLSNVANSTLARFHRGGSIATDNSIDLSRITYFHQGGAITRNAESSESRLSPQSSALSTFHVGGSIGPTINATHVNNVMNAATLPRFHDGGGLKSGERMIIAEDGEFVIKKQTAQKIGMENLQKLNRAEATVTPKFHFGGIIRLSSQPSVLSTFHQGGAVLRTDRTTVINHAAALMPRFHDGGDVSATQRWSGTSVDLSALNQTGTIPDDALMTTGAMSKRQSANGPTANIANFFNPQFQSRQSVGQTTAQLTAAMEAGKRNR